MIKSSIQNWKVIRFMKRDWSGVVVPKLDDTQIPPEQIIKNAVSQAQTSGPSGICILFVFFFCLFCFHFYGLMWDLHF